MPCTLCPHPKCKHSMIRQGVSSCPECDNGTLVLDPVSAPKWRVDCNRCSFLIYLPAELHNAKLASEHCQVRHTANCKEGILVICVPCAVIMPWLLKLKFSKASCSRTAVSLTATVSYCLVASLPDCHAVASFVNCTRTCTVQFVINKTHPDQVLLFPGSLA